MAYTIIKYKTNDITLEMQCPCDKVRGMETMLKGNGYTILYTILRRF